MSLLIGRGLTMVGSSACKAMAPSQIEMQNAFSSVGYLAVQLNHKVCMFGSSGLVSTLLKTMLDGV